MLGLGNALNKVKSLVPKVVNAGNKAVKTAVKKVADSALGRAVASIPSAVRTGAAKVGQITRKAVAAIPKIIEPVKKKVVEKAVQIKKSVTAKATQIKSAVNAGIGQANQAIVNKSNQVKQAVGQIQNTVELKVNEFNTVTAQKDKRIVEKMKAEWENTCLELSRGVTTEGAAGEYLLVRTNPILLDFFLKYRRSVIEEYPFLEFPVPVLRGPLNFIRSEITNKGAAAGSFIYKQKIPGLSDFFGELTDQRDPGAESNAFSIVGAGARGIVVKGLLGTVDGIASLIEDPVAALEGINSIVAYPDETIPVICEGVKTFWNEKVVNGSPEDRAEVFGQAVFEAATWLAGVGEAKTGANLGKTTKIACSSETAQSLSTGKKLLKTSKLADNADTLADTYKIAKSVETVIGKGTSKINKTWLKNLGKATAKKLDDVLVKSSKKTGDILDNIRRGIRQNSNGPKLALESVGDIESLTSTGDAISDYYSRFKKFAKNKLDNAGNHNVNIKSKVELDDISKSIKNSGDGLGAITEGTGSLLDDTGKFVDDILENNYQKYVERKGKTGQPIRNRSDWKEASDYWTKESPIARGNKYNQAVRDADLYPYDEIHLANGKRLDSYDPVSGEIISRKATDLDKITESTFRGYLSEINEKYSAGTVIRSDKYPQLDGLKLEGQYILEIPASNATISNIQHYKDIANEYGVILRFTEEIP